MRWLYGLMVLLFTFSIVWQVHAQLTTVNAGGKGGTGGGGGGGCNGTIDLSQGCTLGVLP